MSDTRTSDEGVMLGAVLPKLAAAMDIPLKTLESYYRELQLSTDFLEDLNNAVKTVPEFHGAHFDSVDDLRLYRCMLYVLTRAVQPNVFIETGTLNGFGSAFILLGLRHNGGGMLYSVDMPPADARIVAQGTSLLPAGKDPGWVIPEKFLDQHQMHLGNAEVLLPQLLREVGPADVFLHDSDHSYTHMMFELTLGWINVRPGGWIACDNVELNDAFADFARGAGVDSTVMASFDSPGRTWKTGLFQKPA
ncbi:MAG TPA: class I SAM-dependent methyltransferase [Pseudonocardiaceae bacterium]|nr:class I SAM-dependent methyltransferase [Pseudonocardiaceae bacterium]